VKKLLKPHRLRPHPLLLLPRLLHLRRLLQAISLLLRRDKQHLPLPLLQPLLLQRTQPRSNLRS
jgi:hypothetical protein